MEVGPRALGLGTWIEGRLDEEASGRPLGAVSVGPIFGVLGVTWRAEAVEASWTSLGVSRAPLGRSWDALGRSWGALGRLLDALGALLNALGAPLGRSWIPKVPQDPKITPNCSQNDPKMSPKLAQI